MSKSTRSSGSSTTEAEVAYLTGKIERLVEAIESMGISDTLAERLRRLEAEKRGAEALLGKVEIRPKRGVPWPFPTLKTQGLAEASPVPIILVAGASFVCSFRAVELRKNLSRARIDLRSSSWPAP